MPQEKYKPSAVYLALPRERPRLGFIHLADFLSAWVEFAPARCDFARHQDGKFIKIGI